MNKIIIIILLIVLNLLITGQSYAQDWRQLRPVSSKRSDVEKLLGRSRVNIKGFGIYETADHNISVWYSLGRCKVKLGLNWNITKVAVTLIEIRPKHKEYLSDLEWDISSFARSNHPTDEYRFGYSSPDEDIDVTTFLEGDGSETVDYIAFRPGKKFAYLLCKSKSKLCKSKSKRSKRPINKWNSPIKQEKKLSVKIDG